jgi:hypothetical protein
VHPSLSATLLWTNQSTVGTTLASGGHSDTIDVRHVNAVWLAASIGDLPANTGRDDSGGSGDQPGYRSGRRPI